MTNQIATGAIHHIALTVSDVARSLEFYSLLGFQKIGEFGPKTLLHNGSTVLGLALAPEQAIAGDAFSENRIGLDHVSFAVATRADLEQAVQVLDANGIPRGEPKDLPPFQICVLAFRDPDNIQVELTSPMA